MGKTQDILDKLTGNDQSQELVEKNEQPVEKVDRSAYNCTACGGEGMTFPAHAPEGIICLVCHGTGKI